MFDKEEILVVKILGNQSLAYYQLVYLKLFQCLRESIVPKELSTDSPKSLSHILFVVVQSVLLFFRKEGQERAGKVSYAQLDLCKFFNYKIIWDTWLSRLVG